MDKFIPSIERLKVIKSYPATLAREAVYSQLTNRDPQSGWPAIAKDISVLWGERIRQLGELGWPKHVNSRDCRIYQNCPPHGFKTVPVRPCGATTICPFCYSRQLAGLFTSIFGILKSMNKSGHPGTIIVFRHGLKPIDQFGRPLSLARQFRRCRKRRKLIARYQPAAAYLRNFITPGATPDIWQHTRSGLMVFTDCYEFPDDLFPFPVRICKAPSRQELMQSMAWAFAYPAALLLDPPEAVVRIMKAWKGHRLSAAYGLLHQ